MSTVPASDIGAVRRLRTTLSSSARTHALLRRAERSLLLVGVMPGTRAAWIARVWRTVHRIPRTALATAATALLAAAALGLPAPDAAIVVLGAAGAVASVWWGDPSMITSAVLATTVCCVAVMGAGTRPWPAMGAGHRAAFAAATGALAIASTADAAWRSRNRALRRSAQTMPDSCRAD